MTTNKRLNGLICAMMCFKSTKLLLEDFQEYVFVDKIFEEYFSATGCCEVGPTDDWKNAESAAELSRVLRWIHLLTSGIYSISLKVDILKILM